MAVFNENTVGFAYGIFFDSSILNATEESYESNQNYRRARIYSP